MAKPTASSDHRITGLEETFKIIESNPFPSTSTLCAPALPRRTNPLPWAELCRNRGQKEAPQKLWSGSVAWPHSHATAMLCAQQFPWAQLAKPSLSLQEINVLWPNSGLFQCWSEFCVDVWVQELLRVIKETLSQLSGTCVVTTGTLTLWKDSQRGCSDPGECSVLSSLHCHPSPDCANGPKSPFQGKGRKADAGTDMVWWQRSFHLLLPVQHH